MKLATKIIIGFFCISLLLALIGFISDVYTDNVRSEQLALVNEGTDVMAYTSEMERSLYQSLIFLNAIRESKDYEASEDGTLDYPPVPELRRQFESELDEFEEAMKNINSLALEDSTFEQSKEELNGNFTVYRSVSREWLGLDEENYEQANMMFITSIEPYFRNNIIPRINEVRSGALAVQADRLQQIDDSLRRASIINFTATILSILFAIALAVYIYRSIANPLMKLNAATRQIGRGNLDERISIESNDEIGELSDSINEMAANLQMKTVSKEYLDNIIESIQEILLVTDKDGQISMVNSSASRILGYKEHEFKKMTIGDIFIPDKERFKKLDNSENKTSGSFEFALRKKDGTILPVLFSEADLYDHKGGKIGKVSVGSDISDRIQREKDIKDSLREKEVLLAEIHHRVKNNLAVISGLLQLQSFSAGNEIVEKALTDSQLRIQSIALVHEMLYQSETLAHIDYNEYVNDLLQAISSMHMQSDKDITLSSELEPVVLSLNQAIPCSLLLNELIVNSFKHAFDGKKHGEIKVILKKDGEEVIMTVVDNGNGMDPDELLESESLGATLIKTLSSQLNGEYTLDNPDGDGTYFQIRFQRSD